MKAPIPCNYMVTKKHYNPLRGKNKEKVQVCILLITAEIQKSDSLKHHSFFLPETEV